MSKVSFIVGVILFGVFFSLRQIPSFIAKRIRKWNTLIPRTTRLFPPQFQHLKPKAVCLYVSLNKKIKNTPNVAALWEQPNTMHWHLDTETSIQHLGGVGYLGFFATHYPYLICMKFRHLHRGVRCVQILFVNSSSAVLHRSNCQLQVEEPQQPLMVHNFSNSPFTWKSC